MATRVVAPSPVGVPERGTRRWGGGHRQDQPGGEAGGWRLRRGRARPLRTQSKGPRRPVSVLRRSTVPLGDEHIGRGTGSGRRTLGSASLRVSPGAHRSLASRHHLPRPKPRSCVSISCRPCLRSLPPPPMLHRCSSCSTTCSGRTPRASICSTSSCVRRRWLRWSWWPSRYRCQPDSPFDAALAALGLTSHVRSISLTGLNPHETAEITLRRSQNGQTLHRLTGGNPFLLRQMLSTDGMADQSLPVADLVATRSASLRGPAKSVLSFAAVVGSEFGLDVLTHVTGRDCRAPRGRRRVTRRSSLMRRPGASDFGTTSCGRCSTQTSAPAAARCITVSSVMPSNVNPPWIPRARAGVPLHTRPRSPTQIERCRLRHGGRQPRLAAPCVRGGHRGVRLGVGDADRLTQDDLARRMDLLYERGRACLGAGAAHWESGQADLWHVVDLAEANADALQAARAVIELSENTLTAGGDARLADQQLRCLARLEVFADDAAAGAQRASSPRCPRSLPGALGGARRHWSCAHR